MGPASALRALDLTLCAAMAVVLAAALALVEVFWLPLRIGGLLLPVSVLAAVVGNLLLVELAHRATGSRVIALLPAATWLVVAFSGSRRRPEGDLLIVGSGALGAAGLAFLLLGVLAAAVAVGRALSPSAPAGSGSGGAR